MKLTKETQEEIKQYCLDAINSDDTTFKNDTERVQYAYTRFKSDYGHMIKRIGEFKAFAEWLQGLNLDIAYMNYKILELAHKWGQYPTTEAQEDKIISEWWDFMTNQYFKLFRAHLVV